MKKHIRLIRHLSLLLLPIFAHSVNIGIGKSDITPPIGTPSAGYQDRKGAGMLGIHDPLLATALFIDNGKIKTVFCSVDHLGFTSSMVQKVIKKVHELPDLLNCHIYIGSSHTHSGGGAFLDIPIFGKAVAGDYNATITEFYIEKTVEAIVQSSKNVTAGKLGIGYGHAHHLSLYRASWPMDVEPLTDLTVLKITDLNDVPIAVLFNFPLHPTLLKSHHALFSADFVGYARKHIQSFLGKSIEPVYFNGALGDINPIRHNCSDDFASCEYLGLSLAEAVKSIWDQTSTSEEVHIVTEKTTYTFKPQLPIPKDKFPINTYLSEINLIILNQLHAFITIPGELSCIYDKRLKCFGEKLGFIQTSILGLTNDAHGYILLPGCWEHNTKETLTSFGGENYGEDIFVKAKALLENGHPYRHLSD